jgi:MoaA/NifB/PqqE/SkfB family radical SAM enzyme
MEIFAPISDSAYTEHIMSCWPNFDLRDGLLVNSEVGIYGQEIKEVDVCPYIFYSFSINSDGKVSACFLDWSRDLLVGDVLSEDILNIWSGPRMNALRRFFLEGKRKNHPICGNCGQMTHGAPDNIDQYKAELLKKFDLELF